MFNTLYLLNYNNYYNRLVKKEDSLEGYLPYVVAQLNATNFSPNDHINTEHIVNIDDYITPDYAVLIDDAGNIVSRWFVLDSVRVRGGQYKLNLYRDTIADYYNIIMTAPCFVERGFVNNDNILIYNNENVSFNQIKTAEYVLENNLKTPWIVAYLSRYKQAEVGGNTPESPAPDPTEVYNVFKGTFREERSAEQPDYILNSLSDYKYFRYIQNEGGGNLEYVYDTNIKFGIRFSVDPENDRTGPETKYPNYNLYGLSSIGDFTEETVGSDENITYPVFKGNVIMPFFRSLETLRYQELLQEYNSYYEVDPITELPINTYSGLGTYREANKIRAEGNKIIKVGDKYYRIVIKNVERYVNDMTVGLPNSAGTFGRRIFNTIIDGTLGSGTWTIPDSAYIGTNTVKIIRGHKSTEGTGWAVDGVQIYLQDISNSNVIEYDFTYDGSVTAGVPYEIIAAPFYNTDFTIGNTTFRHNGSIALSWFAEMAQLGNVYDLQLVPYVGVISYDITKYSRVNCYYEGIPESPLAVAIKIPNASFSERYDFNLPTETDYKIATNCDLYRLCSPNGIGDFDFNPAKNGGFLGYEVDCTLIPYAPYIKINPVFQNGYLYGGDYNDYRGLICKGDFSLPRTDDQWENYQLNNKYYNDIFNRETQTLETQNKWERRETWIGAGSGLIQGGAMGGAAGFMIGGPTGAAVGAGISSLLSGGGGALDIWKMYELQKEMMSSREDLFDYNLKTIQARPNTLTKTSSYNINNKYFPYIEYYTCTDKEKDLFKKSIKYNGMTINAIGTLYDYVNPFEQTYVRGTIIRLEDVNEDFHVTNTIVKEVKNGLYIGGQ